MLHRRIRRSLPRVLKCIAFLGLSTLPEEGGPSRPASKRRLPTHLMFSHLNACIAYRRVYHDGVMWGTVAPHSVTDRETAGYVRSAQLPFDQGHVERSPGPTCI